MDKFLQKRLISTFSAETSTASKVETRLRLGNTSVVWLNWKESQTTLKTSALRTARWQLLSVRKCGCFKPQRDG